MEEDILESLRGSDSQITRKGTNNETGTGLGLSLCRELIDMQGGKIRIESKAGEGTLITFTLPGSEG